MTSVELNQVTMMLETYVRNAQYDQLNRMTQMDEIDRLNPLNILTSTFQHDSKSCMTYRTDAMGDTVTFDFDGLRRNTRTIYDLRNGGIPVGAITVETGYDRNSNVIWREDDNNNRTNFGFNARDEMTSITYADLSAKTIQRDLCGNPTMITDQNGSVITTIYNQVNLPTNRNIMRAPGVGGVTFENYQWDACRRCIHADNDDSMIDPAYDSLDNTGFEQQILTAWPQPHMMMNQMDACSNIVMIDHEGWFTNFNIDANRRRTSIAAGGMPVADYWFAGPGVRTMQVSMFNTAVMNATSDGFAREATRDWSSLPQPVIASFTNTYNNRHERLSETWNHYMGFFTDVTLDSASRTTASRFKTDPITLIPVQNCTYDIDGVDNRITVTTNGAPTAYTTNAINAYPTVGGVIRTYDANGNLINDGNNVYTYNYRNELIQVNRFWDNFLLQTSTFDPFSRRVSREYWDAQAGVYRALRYMYNGWQVKAEYEPGAPEVLFCRYAYGNGIDEPLMLEVRDVNDVNGNYNTAEYLKYYYHRDTLGSITHMTDAAGFIVERYECTPFGQTTIYTGTGPDGLWNTPDDQVAPFSRIYNTYIFQARRLDQESGLYYFRSRHYSPDEGRFIQRDRPGDWYDPTNLGNGYNFVGSDPFTYIDPFGYSPSNSQWADRPIINPDESGNEQGVSHEFIVYGPSKDWPSGMFPGIPDPKLTPKNTIGMAKGTMGINGRKMEPVYSDVEYTITREIINASDWRTISSITRTHTSGNVTTHTSLVEEERDVEMVIRIYIKYTLTDQWGQKQTVGPTIHSTWLWKGTEYRYGVYSYSITGEENYSCRGIHLVPDDEYSCERIYRPSSFPE